MLTLFSHSIQTEYKASLCSKVAVFYLATTVLTFVPPLLIAYRSQGFWQKIDTYQEQPDIHFEHDLLLLMETADPDKSFGWSTMSNFNELLDYRIKTPLIKSTETDWNRDGRLDSIKLSIEVPADDHEAIYGVQVFLLFDVKLYKYSTVHMHGLVYLSASTGLPSAGLTINGDLNIIQRQPLSHKGQDLRYSSPLFNRTSIYADAFNFKKIISDYSQRNVSLKLQHEYLMWDRGVTGRGNPFRLSFNLNYPEQTLTYYTGFWQMLKWAWVQYAAILIVFMAFFYEIKYFVFSKQVLPSVVSSPLMKK